MKLMEQQSGNRFTAPGVWCEQYLLTFDDKAVLPALETAHALPRRANSCRRIVFRGRSRELITGHRALPNIEWRCEPMGESKNVDERVNVESRKDRRYSKD